MGKRRPRGDEEDNGFAQWGGYMNAKKAKLVDQFHQDSSKSTTKSTIFKGIAIMVNGWTKPSADELKILMSEHGGLFHLYQMTGFTGATTHIIATNLPNFKIKNMGNLPVVTPDWITDSIKQGRKLNYKKYLLYTNQSRTQPRLDFMIQNKNLSETISKPGPSSKIEEPNSNNINDSERELLLNINNTKTIKNGFSKRTKSQTCFIDENKQQRLLSQKVKSDGDYVPSSKEDLFMKINFDEFIRENEKYLSPNKAIKQLINPVENSENTKHLYYIPEDDSESGNTSDIDLFTDYEENSNNLDNYMQPVLETNNSQNNSNVHLSSEITLTKTENNVFSKIGATVLENKETNNLQKYSKIQTKTENNISSIIGATTVLENKETNNLQNNMNENLNLENSSTKTGNNISSKISTTADKCKEVINDVQTTKGEQSTSLHKTTDVKTASDPKFLSEFYNNSRLHLIATLGAEFKQLVCTMREKSNGVFPGKDKLLQNNKNIVEENTVFDHPPVIMHIDMDCFFVSVGLRNHPELRGKPVAVAHAKGNPTKSNPERQAEFALYAQRLPEGAMSRVENIDETSSMSELASCSYEARKCGIKNGMFLGTALKLCPELKTIPYDFAGYKEVSKTLYETIAQYTLDIEAVSCDEMYVDITKILEGCNITVYEWATHIRNEISDKTGCPCSTGFGSNRLQARLATRKAKPNGQYYLNPTDVESYFYDIPLADLPGVGRSTLYKLENMGLKVCGDVQNTPIHRLQKELGVKAGETIYEQSKGVDKKPLNYEHERKSVSAEVNYGIRFKNKVEALEFFEKLSEEVYSRLKELKMKARSVTLKVMIRAADAPKETAKFLGHGVCDSLSRTTTTNYLINDSKAIFKEVKILYEKLNLQPTELRGVGIQLGRLEKTKSETACLTNFLKGKTTNNKIVINTNTIITKEITNTPLNTTKNSTDNESHINNIKILDNINIKNSVITKNEVNGTALANCSTFDVKNTGNIKLLDDIKINNSILSKDDNISNTTSNDSSNVATSSKSDNSVLNKSRRGRPKGSTNKKIIKSQNKNLTNFFKSGKMDSTRNNNCSLQDNAGHINFDVLDELPHELRQEILSNIEEQNRLLGAYNTGKFTPKSKSQKLNGATEKTTNKSDTVVNKESTVLKINTEPKKFGFETLDKEGVKLLIKNWVKTDKPLLCDINMLGEHFKQLAVNRKIEVLDVLIRFLHRILNKKDCSWHNSYFIIVNFVQQGMLAQYGYILQIPNKFDCESCNK